MSIKSGLMELYVGKKESKLFTITGNLVKIVYADLDRIEYCYPSFGDGGYIDFIYPGNKSKRFSFTKKVNDKISRTVDLIRENNENIWIEEKQTENLRFYQRAWFTILMMFCCCFPLGLFLMWHNKKFLFLTRAIITFVFSTLWTYKFIEFLIALNGVSNSLQSIQNSLYGF